MNRFLLFFAFICCAVANLDLPHPKTLQIESLVGFAGPDDTVLDNDPSSFAGAVVIDGVSQANGLDMDCNNKFCSMMRYAVSCKALGFGIKKICARYLLGYKYGCDIFPAPTEVVNAPSICLPSVFRILPYLQQGAAGLQMLIGPYLNATTFSENTCGRNCYQNYQNASHEFYKSCRPQMNATLVPLAFAISNFQEFRNQACSENPKEKNCYSLIAGLVPPSSATVTEMVDYAVQNTEEERRVLTETAAKTDAADATSVTAAAAAPLSARNKHTEATDLLDFACDYGLGYQTNLLVEAQVCMKLSTFGCCAATGITMVTQNPVGGLAAVAAGGKPDPTIFPPCLLKYLNDVCPAVDLQLYCTNGSIANTAVISGVISMPKLTVPVQLKSFPNMYDKASVLTLQGVLTTGLAQVPGFTQWPFLFNPVLPLTVQIMDYTYYEGTNPITPNNGTMAQPYGSDFARATSGTFSFQIVMQDLNATTSAMVYGALTSPYVVGTLNQAYTGSTSNTAVQVTTSTAPEVFPPNPLVHNSGMSVARGMKWAASLFVALGMSALLLGPDSVMSFW